MVKDGDEVMLITDRGQTLRTGVAEIRETGRNAQGVKLMTLDAEERIVALERMAETAVDEAPGGGSGESAPPDGSLPPPSMPPPEPGDLN
jgi:DNA gyrase subunit A